MASLDIIKSKIQILYKTNPNIRLNVAITRSKKKISNEPAVIKGVYPHFFQIEERCSGTPKRHTIQYAELLMHNVEIVELGDI